MKWICNCCLKVVEKDNFIEVLEEGVEDEEYHDFTEEEIWTFHNSSWQIMPVNFQKRHREMLQWTYTLMSKRLVKIHPTLQELIVSLRTAVVIDDWRLDKYQTSHDDLLDAFRLACLNYEPPRNKAVLQPQKQRLTIHKTLELQQRIIESL